MNRSLCKVPPFVLPDIFPSRGEIGSSTAEISRVFPIVGGMPAGRGGRLARTLQVLSFAILVLAPLPAFAASTLGTSYGDEDGCRYAKTGQSSGSDAFLLLTDEGLTTSTAVCAFVGPLKTTASGFEGMATCKSEGEGGEPGRVELLKDLKGYTVAFDDGTRYGPLTKCR